MTTRLVEGSAVVAEAMVRAGCRFFAGYPMTPFTEVLEHMAESLPRVDGVCINAESELEAVGMVWGAAAAGARAATGSTGQGLSLMQESIAEAAMAGIGFVVLNMARGQGDYFQATRGGGHGDYRTPVLAPSGPAEVTELVADAFELAERWRNPVVVVGDYYMAHTWVDLDVAAAVPDPPPAPDWALDGSSGGTGSAKLVSPLGTTKQRDGVGYDLAAHYDHCAQRRQAMTEGIAPRAECLHTDDADVVLVAYGTMARYAEAVVTACRTEGLRLGLVRPITLWPYPSEIVAEACAETKVVAVYENNAGQMIDDVNLALLGAAPVVGINGFRTDSSAFGIAPDVTVENLTASVQALFEQYG
ncbi:MAG: hypothetical protein HKN26_14560 [Acidimicrobiales bacterium]|nr:hypothetical protein [Acidimicrobiales bacterium]